MIIDGPLSVILSKLDDNFTVFWLKLKLIVFIRSHTLMCVQILVCKFKKNPPLIK